ncbi:protein MODIFIER OF SNC1 1-like isoform X2 [Impatiens glandulifera]|uniref:protein MODIFIER OF SNC1 1-like isoform X2 n=1 Tax=Impatiens glandulifera TaxID=253017 RepID=UPI001FB0B633|nr:protein MODIFIER OF SNC1 1-like isoform X2 [Impatiens glandulifera]
MSSNMLVGEKRWVSSRRTGMTLLGKVVVPKPINLPSQRLENHGLDPNAEIVPKGTINWGNRSSLSTVNAWNSLASSPKSDAGSGFSSDVSARPSSGGSGTRPSTAASDRVHESVPSAWGSNSRPSSASGPLSSNQSSLTSLRPRSAETRPGSSQLSRFAEPLADNSVTLIPSDISEKSLISQGGLSSTSDGFNLSCGDFPTLGSQKGNSGKNTDYRDNGSDSRPRSSSSMAASVKEKKADASIGDASINSNVKTENVDTWRRDGSEHFEDGAKHNVVNWQGGDTHAYPNPNMPPQLVDAWHGHPGVWYRGPPLGPGGFPLDPFPYYGPQIQTAGLANSRPMAPPNNRPRGHHPGNPDHWPHIPDTYMHPSMPIRPGFYSSPMPYESYYRPPMVFSSSKEHDIPFNGTPPGPPVYNRYSVENSSNPGKEHARDVCAGKSFSSEHVESGYQNNNQGQCKILLKQHHEVARKEDSSDWKQTVPMMSTSKVDKRGLVQTLVKDERGNGRTNESGRHHKQDTRSWSVGNQKHDSNTSKSNVYFNSSNMNAVDFDSATNSHNSASSVSSTPKPILVEKIEGLNAKARVSEGLLNVGVNVRGNNYHANDKNREGRDHHSIHSEETDVPMRHMNPNPTAFNNGGADLPRVPGHGMQGKLDHHHHGKRFNAQGGDGWQKKPHTVEVATVISGGNIHLQTPEDAVEKQSRTNYKGSKVEEEHSFSEFDISNDERAKMRETAKERAKQLQREEEERTKDLKAKALAKLEELNKRAQPAFGLVQKVETPGSASVVEQERTKEELKAKALGKKLEEVNKSVQPAYGLVQKVKTPGSASVAEQEKRETNLSTTSTLDSSNARVVVVAEGNPMNEPCHTDSTECKAVPPPSEGNIMLSRHKAMGHNYKQKENGGTRGKMMILTEKSSAATTVPGNPNEGGVVDKETTLSLKNVADSPAAADNNRKKNNRSNKMKPKLDDDATTVKNSSQQASAEFPETVSKDHSVRSDLVQKDTVTTIEEEADSRIINHNMKTGRARSFPKNQQTNRKFEKFRGGSDCVIWAPVRAQNNTEENGKKTCDEIPTVGKGETEEGGENNEKKKNKKRAEVKRYVPKPVVVAMGGDTQLTPPDEVVVAVEEKEESGSQKMVCPDHQHPLYKQKKTHGWRQRESSTNGQSSKGVETKSCDVGNAEVDYSGSFPDEESKGFHVDERGMRRYTKEKSPMHFNNGGNNPDKKMATTGQKEKGDNNALKENRGSGDRNAASSHWQPKSQQSNSSSSSRVEQEVVVAVKKESKITLAPVPAVVEYSSSLSHDNNNNVEEDTRLLSKNGNQNSRYGKSSSYQYHNNNNNRERQRQKDNYSRMEYKPVGGQKHNNSHFEEETGESSSSRNNTTRYYREKNQSHSAVHY